MDVQGIDAKIVSVMRAIEALPAEIEWVLKEKARNCRRRYGASLHSLQDNDSREKWRKMHFCYG